MTERSLVIEEIAFSPLGSLIRDMIEQARQVTGHYPRIVETSHPDVEGCSIILHGVPLVYVEGDDEHPCCVTVRVTLNKRSSNLHQRASDVLELVFHSAVTI